MSPRFSAQLSLRAGLLASIGNRSCMRRGALKSLATTPYRMSEERLPLSGARLKPAACSELWGHSSERRAFDRCSFEMAFYGHASGTNQVRPKELLSQQTARTHIGSFLYQFFKSAPHR